MAMCLQVYPGVYLGKLLGAGSQAKVFTLVDKDGKSLDKVLKIGHTDLMHTLVLNEFAASMMDLRHEWELGIHLMAVLRDEKGYLPGYTQTFDACVSKKDGQYVFRGMILEQIKGNNVMGSFVVLGFQDHSGCVMKLMRYCSVHHNDEIYPSVHK